MFYKTVEKKLINLFVGFWIKFRLLNLLERTNYSVYVIFRWCLGVDVPIKNTIDVHDN